MNIKSKLRTVYGTNRGCKIHAHNGITYPLTKSLFGYARGYFLLQQTTAWNGSKVYQVLQYVIPEIDCPSTTESAQETIT